MATSTVKPERQANNQPNHLPATIKVNIAWDGGAGELAIPQTATLSAKGNISFAGGVKKGLRFVGDPTVVLASLVLAANDKMMTQAAAGVHLSSPRTTKDGKAIPNTGNNLTVCHTAIVDLDSTSGDTVGYQVQVYVTYLGEEKGYSLSVKGFVRPVNIGGPTVVGELTGLTVS